jgi:protein SCO1
MPALCCPDAQVADASRRRFCAAAAAAACGAHPGAAAATVGVDALPDADLLRSDGRPVRLKADVIRDRLVLLNFVFATCSSLCPPQSAVMADVQSRWQDRLGRDIVLASLSLDPLNDDPPRLAQFARGFAPGAHWWWLTGAPRTVFRLLEGLGAGTGGDPASHAPVLLAGRSGRGDWQRLVGLPARDQIDAAIRRYL